MPSLWRSSVVVTRKGSTSWFNYLSTQIRDTVHRAEEPCHRMAWIGGDSHWSSGQGSSSSYKQLPVCYKPCPVYIPCIGCITEVRQATSGVMRPAMLCSRNCDGEESIFLHPRLQFKLTLLSFSVFLHEKNVTGILLQKKCIICSESHCLLSHYFECRTLCLEKN